MQLFRASDSEMVNFWNNHGGPDIAEMAARGVQTMTYDAVIQIIKNMNDENSATLDRVQVMILDEVHVILSDAGFMSGMDAFQVFLRDAIYKEPQKLVIGLTATPGIYNAKMDGLRLKTKDILGKNITNYKANRLICTVWNVLPKLLTSGVLHGRTLVLCHSAKACVQMASSVPNSAYVVSTSNRDHLYKPEYMDQIREAVVTQSTIPEYVEYTDEDTGGLVRQKIDVLFVTTTFREGFNLVEESGVRNIVSCIPDELHVCQIAGRCRYNFDCLVVVRSRFTNQSAQSNPYLHQEALKFYEYMKDHSKTDWYKSISHIVRGGPEDVEFYHADYQVEEVMDALEPFISYGDASVLWPKESFDEVVQVAKDVNLIPDKRRDRHTLLAILGYLKQINLLTYRTAYKPYNGKKNAAHYEIRRNGE